MPDDNAYHTYFQSVFDYTMWGRSGGSWNQPANQRYHPLSIAAGNNIAIRTYWTNVLPTAISIDGYDGTFSTGRPSTNTDVGQTIAEPATISYDWRAYWTSGSGLGWWVGGGAAFAAIRI
jgi:hypothetical protein